MAQTARSGAPRTGQAGPTGQPALSASRGTVRPGAAAQPSAAAQPGAAAQSGAAAQQRRAAQPHRLAQAGKPQPQKYRFLPLIALAVAVAFIGGLGVLFVRSFLHAAPPMPKHVIQEVKLIRPPPPPPEAPPPPPPPPEEKVDVPDPQQKPDPTPSNDPPPGEQLGLDQEGGAGGDAFGLLGNKGGRELIGGGGGSVYAWYAGLLKNEILDRLGAQEQARNAAFSIVVRVWVGADGTIQRVHIQQSSGNPDRDRSIETALSGMTRLSQPPPADMPEPITLRIVSRS